MRTIRSKWIIGVVGCFLLLASYAISLRYFRADEIDNPPPRKIVSNESTTIIPTDPAAELPPTSVAANHSSTPVASTNHAARTTTSMQSQASTNAASQPTTQPIVKGFVFYGGKYIKAPYYIKIKDAAVVINDKLPVFHAAPPISPSSEEEDPGPPPNLSANSTWHDLFVKTGKDQLPHVMRKWQYIKNTTADDKVVDAMIEYLKGLPQIDDVTRTDISMGNGNVVLKVTMKHGSPEFFMPGSVTKEARKQDVVDVTSRLTNRAIWIETLLNQGSCMFFNSRGDIETLLGHERVAASLGAAVEILVSNRDVRAKAALLQKAKVIRPGEFTKTPELIENFKPSDQLDQRIMQAVQETGVTPLQVKDLETAGKDEP